MANNYTIILIGNGLGMALKPEHFRIDQGLQKAWDQLEPEDQSRIKSLITNSNKIDNEQQLDKHYDAIEACLILEKIEKISGKSWLSNEAVNFPKNFRYFVLNTALHFFYYEIDENKDLFNKFYNSLIEYISKNDTHIVTLSQTPPAKPVA